MGEVYLNNAAESWPKAPGVQAAVLEGISAMPEHPGRGMGSFHDLLGSCRACLAELLGVENPDRIVLTSSGTHSLNLAIWGLGLKPGDEVVVSVTEHNSMLRPLFRMKAEMGLRLTVIGMTSDGLFDEEEYGRALSRRPKLVALNHISNVTGWALPVGTLFERAHSAGVRTLLDAAQSIGHVSVDADGLHADMIAFPGHKGLRGPSGTGGLYVREGLELQQVFVGGTGVRSDLLQHPQEMPLRLEAGTPNVPALAGLLAALRWGAEHGAGFARVLKERVDRLRAGIVNLPGVRVYNGVQSAQQGGIVSFRLDGLGVDETGYALAKSFGILCRTGLHCAPLIHEDIGSHPDGTIRFSPSGATTEEEIEQAICAVRRMAECA